MQEYINQADPNNWKCSACSSNCLTCQDSPTFCLSCQSGLNLSASHTCVYWQSSVSGYLVCASVCRTCFQSATSCTSCFEGTFLWNQTCLEICPSTTFGFNGVCTSCAEGCNTCSLRSSNCTSCLPNKTLFKQTCLDSLPMNLWYNSVTMSYEQCSSSCLRCSSTYVCTQCPLGMSLSPTSTCVASCNSNYYSDSSSVCRRCDPNCLNCQGSPTTCSSCLFPNLLTWNQTCRASDVVFSNEIVISQVILQCKSPCSQCKGTQTFCTSCINGFYLSPATGLCMSIAPQGFVNVQGVLLACDFCCLNCVGSPTNCASCRSAVPYLYNGKCVAQCSSSQYLSGSNCLDCSPNCLTCSVQPSQCTSCPNGSYLSPQMSCLNMGSPISCSYGCLSCSSNTYCTLCDNQYTRTNDGKCLMGCPSGSFLNNNICVSCPLGCSSCINSSKCTSCFQQMFLTTDFKCTTTCPIGSYSNTTDCLPCPFPMTTC